MKDINATEVLYIYQLIDWLKPNNPYKYHPVVELTMSDAHDLNHALALNHQTKRYIKQ